MLSLARPTAQPLTRPLGIQPRLGPPPAPATTRRFPSDGTRSTGPPSSHLAGRLGPASRTPPARLLPQPAASSPSDGHQQLRHGMPPTAALRGPAPAQHPAAGHRRTRAVPADAGQGQQPLSPRHWFRPGHRYWRGCIRPTAFRSMNNGTVVLMPCVWKGRQLLVLASQWAALWFHCAAGCPGPSLAGSPNGLEVLVQELS